VELLPKCDCQALGLDIPPTMLALGTHLPTKSRERVETVDDPAQFPGRRAPTADFLKIAQG
jgi:hypothetical protein